ncbi:MAG: transglycosylase SLT domain-containing protein [Treponema sp.]|jgi:membrane-bound lytic murein transglycosylase D|nr:transglycosylase SLT domain-containing protein [Treponema sp.]
MGKSFSLPGLFQNPVCFEKGFLLLILLIAGSAAPLCASDAVPPRPLRNQRAPRPDHPAYRNAVPPFYSENRSGFPGALSLTLLSRDLPEQPLTQYYIRQYSSPGGIEWLKAVMKQGEPYLGFIRQELEQRNLPPELLYLPVIESQYLVTAVSRSGAAGLWQFMKNSIAPFDMKVNDWIDERRDFWKSTLGALRKLEENYNYFGDWNLALAAYNAGLGAVNQAVKKSGTKDYWVLSKLKQLKTETIHYVPKFLAVSYILSNSRRFGLDPVWIEDPGWTLVAAGRQADLNILAAEAGVDPAALKGANRELAYAITPPGPGYYLKVRAEDADKVTAVLARTDLPLVNYYIHTIRSGDTLLALALHYGISVDQILESNPGTRAQYLKIGGKLMIPAFKDAGPYMRPGAGAESPAFTGSHLVKKGETLWSIALAYKTDPEILAEANGMGLNDILREGRVLKTPIKE